MKSNTPTASNLLENPEWVALYGDMRPAHLQMIAEDQAERAAKYFKYSNEFEALLRNITLQKELRA
jgi:hypothetical protein